jgi:hypothetical protein
VEKCKKDEVVATRYADSFRPGEQVLRRVFGVQIIKELKSTTA